MPSTYITNYSILKNYIIYLLSNEILKNLLKSIFAKVKDWGN